jgi:transposase-like protein
MAAANRKNPARAKSSESLYSLHDFLREFPDDEACLAWLWRTRFSPDGERAQCPKCDQERVFKRYKTKQQRQSWTCTGCGHHIHPTAGTIFAKSSRPLTDWFYVMFLVSSSRCGIAAKQVERELGCNYRTAWRMLNKVRHELMSQDDAPLSGEVEADETYVGGRGRKGQRAIGGRSTTSQDSKTPVFGMVQRGGRIVASVVPDAKAATLMPIIRKHVLPSSMVFTDEWRSYLGLTKARYGHSRVHRQSVSSRRRHHPHEHD